MVVRQEAPQPRAIASSHIRATHEDTEHEVVIVGNIDAYLAEAVNARRERCGHPRGPGGPPRPAATGRNGSAGPLGAPARMHGGGHLW